MYDEASNSFVPVKITVKEFSNEENKRIYSVEAIDIETQKKPAGQLVSDSKKNGITPITDFDANIQQLIELAKNTSKVVDENGEPKVVYHQTNSTIYRNVETGENWDDLDWREKQEWEERDDWDDYWQEEDFYTFNRNNARTTVEFDGFFFAPEYDEYHGYGKRTIEAFLNIRKPASQEDYNIDSQYNDAGRKERIRLQENGYDGVIRTEGNEVWEYVAFEPNQIKSATDNIGTFDVNEDDIAFSIIGEKGASALDRADEVTHRMDNLNIAREMETTGKDAKAIRLATGWERGADGKWRYEIEDIEIKNLEPLIDGKYATLGDVVDGTIFQAYPQLKDIPIDTNTSNGDSGSYDSSFHVSKGTIELGEDFIRSVLVHEIQHAIQSIEGWSGGKPSPNDKFFNEMRDRHKVIMDILSNDYNEAELRNLIKQEQDKAKRLIYFEMYEFMRDGMSMDDIRKFYMDEYDSLDRRQREARKEYLNASGEVESRNAQKRMDMSNEQRRETLLADTEDVAREDQIFLMENSGDSEMAEGNLFQYFAGTLSELISRAKASAQGLIKKVIAPVSSRLKDDLAQQGVELDDNYKHVIDNNAIRHTLNNHSGSSEEKRGQIPVTESDFDRIEDVVENYDSIVVDNGKRGNINILYSKTYADGTTIYIEEKRNKRKELAMVTMWKMKNSTLTDANRSETTPIPDLNEVSTGKDTTTSSNTQQNGELFKRGDIYDYKTGDKITMQNVNVALYREHGPYGQALNQDVSFRGVVLGWGKDYQIDVERLNENLDKALIILEEYKEHLTSLKSNATTPAQKVIDEQIAKIDASMDWANQTKENPSLFHERWHNAPFLELLRPIAEEVVNAEFPDNPSVVAQQTAEALGVDIEIDETLPAKGSYNTRTGRIRINPHRHSSPQDIERTILHEVIGHGGLQALTGKHFPKLCQLAYKMMTEAQRADLRSRHGNLSNEEVGALPRN